MRKILLTVTAALLIAGQVQAQSAADVREAVDAQISKFNDEGANLSVESEAVEGDALVLRGVRLAPADSDVVVTAEFLRLTPADDMPGGVLVTVPDVIDVTVAPADGSEPVKLAIASRDFALTTSWLLDPEGDPKMTLTADSIAVSGGAPDHPVLQRLETLLSKVDLNFAFDTASRDGQGSLALDALALNYIFTDPRTGYRVETETNSADQKITFTGESLPEGEEGLDGFVQNGGSFQVKMDSGASTASFATSDPEMPIGMSGTSEGGTGEISMIDGSFLYKVDFDKIDYVLTPNPQVMPLPPFNVTLGSGSMQLRMPVESSNKAQDFRLALAFNDLEVGESVWGMIDPEKTIPRDPATLQLDLSGSAVLDKPLSDMAEVDGPMQMGEVENVDLNTLLLTLGGARLAADGGVTVDNSGPMPMPNGTIDVAVSGAQGLAQKLVDLGLVDQMQVGMMMGMLMAFAKPADGPDSYTSTIEFRDGRILANGTPIQ